MANTSKTPKKYRPAYVPSDQTDWAPVSESAYARELALAKNKQTVRSTGSEDNDTDEEKDLNEEGQGGFSDPEDMEVRRKEQGGRGENKPIHSNADSGISEAEKEKLFKLYSSLSNEDRSRLLGPANLASVPDVGPSRQKNPAPKLRTTAAAGLSGGKELLTHGHSHLPTASNSRREKVRNDLPEGDRPGGRSGSSKRQRSQSPVVVKKRQRVQRVVQSESDPEEEVAGGEEEREGEDKGRNHGDEDEVKAGVGNAEKNEQTKAIQDVARTAFRVLGGWTTASEVDITQRDDEGLVFWKPDARGINRLTPAWEFPLGKNWEAWGTDFMTEFKKAAKKSPHSAYLAILKEDDVQKQLEKGAWGTYSRAGKAKNKGVHEESRLKHNQDSLNNNNIKKLMMARRTARLDTPAADKGFDFLFAPGAQSPRLPGGKSGARITRIEPSWLSAEVVEIKTCLDQKSKLGEKKETEIVYIKRDLPIKRASQTERYPYWAIDPDWKRDHPGDYEKFKYMIDTNATVKPDTTDLTRQYGGTTRVYIEDPLGGVVPAVEGRSGSPDSLRANSPMLQGGPVFEDPLAQHEQPPPCLGPHPVNQGEVPIHYPPNPANYPPNPANYPAHFGYPPQQPQQPYYQLHAPQAATDPHALAAQIVFPGQYHTQLNQFPHPPGQYFPLPPDQHVAQARLPTPEPPVAALPISDLERSRDPDITSEPPFGRDERGFPRMRSPPTLEQQRRMAAEVVAVNAPMEPVELPGRKSTRRRKPRPTVAQPVAGLSNSVQGGSKWMGEEVAPEENKEIVGEEGSQVTRLGPGMFRVGDKTFVFKPVRGS
ncbi:hypothetical protein FRC09_009630 [Ceratobasidium sp. 395]|nr:hypothetical protein FRC09_009630 [Ceratobasidium sp. 395]